MMDVDFDGDVDETDLNLVYWSNGSCAGPNNPNGDVDNDCDVDEDDFAKIISGYGDCEAESSGFSLELAQQWVNEGGWAALQNQTISIDQVVACMNLDAVPERIAAMFDLLDD
jgi:hypothetical protein